MKKHLIKIAVLTLVLFPACKTVKYNTRETAKLNIETKAYIREDMKILEEVKTSDNITQLVEELTGIIERIITVKLSSPDSLNNQYPVEVTATEREYSKGKTVRYEANTEKEQRTESKIQKEESRKESVNEEREKTDKTVVKKTTPAWVTVTAVILSVGVLFFVFLILKKYKII